MYQDDRGRWVARLEDGTKIRSYDKEEVLAAISPETENQPDEAQEWYDFDPDA